jgi:hypothetical protein
MDLLVMELMRLGRAEECLRIVMGTDTEVLEAIKVSVL